MARRSWWKLVPVAVLGVVVARGGACSVTCGVHRQAPDQRLAGHLEALCRVAEHGIEHPEAGVRQMMRYYGDHGPDMLHAFGETVVSIERIDDEDKHDARARLARDRIHAPILACQETWMEFGEAVESDPAAHELLEHGVERLGRTLEIMLGSREGTPLTPTAMLRRIDGALSPPVAAHQPRD